MDFLLGGKKKTKAPKTAQVATPAAQAPAAAPSTSASATPAPAEQPAAQNVLMGQQLQHKTQSKLLSL